MNNLGLTDEEREKLINEVHIVFHLAATLRMEAKLKDSLEMNTVRYQSNECCFVLSLSLFRAFI